MARDIYLSLHASGWEETIERYKPQTGPRAPSGKPNRNSQPPPSELTIGHFMALVRAITSVSPQTFNAYAGALRRIVADIAGLGDDPKRRDTRRGGNHTWIEQVESIPISVLTPMNLLMWKRNYLECRFKDPIQQRKARTSVNAIIRNARALFAEKLLTHLTDEIPFAESPFKSIPLEPRPSHRYHGGSIDIEQVIQNAQFGCEILNLPPLSPEPWKILLLGLTAGLSKKEIDLLEWKSILPNEGIIRILATQYYSPKTEERLGDIFVDQEVLEELLSFKPSKADQFVVHSQRHFRHRQYSWYRCEPHFRILTTWLRSQGFDSPRPIHQLRKEFGSHLCAKEGLFVASRQLRHSNVTTTADYYIDRKERKTVGFGGYLRS